MTKTKDLKGKYFFYSFISNISPVEIGNYSYYSPDGLFSLKGYQDELPLDNVVISFQEISQEQYDKFHKEYPE